MRVFNSFAVATAVSVISLVIMLSQPVGAGTISISAPAVTVGTVSTVSDCQEARCTDGVTTTLSDLSFMASPAFEQPVAWIDSTVSTPVGVPSTPIMTQGLVLSAGTLLDYAWTLTSRAKDFRDSSGEEKPVASTAGSRHPTIHAAPEPDQLAYAAGAAAMCCVWQLRRFRRSRSLSGVTAAVA